MNRRLPILCIVAIGLLTGPVLADSPQSQPAAPATSQPDDWPGFHRGGRLLGVGDPIGPPPMKTRWTYRASRAGFDGSAAIVGDAVYVGDGDGVLHAIDLATGRRRWSYETESTFTASPLACGGRVFIGDYRGRFHCVSARDGKALWKLETDGAINSSANASTDGRSIFFANDPGDIFCLDPADGKQRWKIRIDRTNGAVAVVGPWLWIASCDKKLHQVRASDGELGVQADLGDQTGAAPAVVGEQAIVGVNDAKVVAIDTRSGEADWTYDGVADGQMVYSSAACDEGLVVVGARDNKVHAIDLASGEKRWTFATAGEVDSSPAISDGRVYVGSKDGRFYVLDLKTGRPLWRFDTGREIIASPAIARGVVVVGDSGGWLYCFEPAGPGQAK